MQKKFYKLISEYNEEKLSQRVTMLLNDGWELHGAPTVSDKCLFMQALVMTHEETTH